MNSVVEVDVRAALALLEVQGIATSAQLQVALGKSQPTVSRLMRLMATQGVVVLGRGRRARYGLGRAILSSAAAQQPIWLIDEHGAVTRWGTLAFLAGNQVHVSHAGTEWLTRDALPWFLSPLRHEGFLGRLWARTTALAQRHGDDPQHWSAEQHLYATLAGIHDSPGALLVGDPHEFNRSDTGVDDAQRVRQYDAIAADVTRYMLPARSSAGGEQPKFLRSRPLDADDAKAWKSDCESLVVKFTPLRGTQAFDLGLVDDLGDFDTAVEKALALAHVKTANLIEYRERYDFGNFLSMFGQNGQAKAIKLDLGVEIPKLRSGCLYYLWQMPGN